MKKLFSEFKAFIAKGSVIDLAVGVIIGAAFKGIVDSLVSDIISPLIGLIANTNFTDLVWQIGGVSIKYGSFITAIINFLLMAIVLFLIVKAISATNTNTSGSVAATRSSKSLISAVGPPTSTRIAGEPAAAGRCARIQSMVSRAAMSSGSTDSTADSRPLRPSLPNTGGATEAILGARVISWRIAANTMSGRRMSPA